MRRWLLIVSVFASVAYLFTGNPTVKGFALGPFVVFAILSRPHKRDAGILALGLGFSTLGDVLLDLSPRYFVFGLCAFLATHLTYIVLFLRNRARPFKGDPVRIGAAGLVLLASTALSAWIVPSVGALAVPVIVYICAITAMVVLAILGRFRSPWMAVGAVLFLISDSLLAINKFKTPLPLRDVLVWSTYYLGQCGIALGFLSR